MKGKKSVNCEGNASSCDKVLTCVQTRMMYSWGRVGLIVRVAVIQ